MVSNLCHCETVCIKFQYCQTLLEADAQKGPIMRTSTEPSTESLYGDGETGGARQAPARLSSSKNPIIAAGNQIADSMQFGTIFQMIRLVSRYFLEMW